MNLGGHYPYFDFHGYRVPCGRGCRLFGRIRSITNVREHKRVRSTKR